MKFIRKADKVEAVSYIYKPLITNICSECGKDSEMLIEFEKDRLCPECIKRAFEMMQ